MAKLTSLIQFSGTLDGISVYKMAGVDQPVVRRRGGAPRQKILRDPGFENTRRTMTEFGGRSAATRLVLEALHPLRPGLGMTGQVNKILSAVQKLDLESAWGLRAVALSRCPQLLQGLDISRRLLWDRIIKAELNLQLHRDALSARLDVPPLLPGVNCDHHKTYPYFRIVAVLGVVPDLFYRKVPGAYLPVEGFGRVKPQVCQTSWQLTRKASEAVALELCLKDAPSLEDFSLLLSAAVQYGSPGAGGTIELQPHAVASKILAVG